MNKIWTAALIMGVCAGLSACGMTKEKLGMGKKAPNEFMVSTRAPLSLPPKYDLLPVNQQNYTDGSASERQSVSEESDLSKADKKLLSKMED